MSILGRAQVFALALTLTEILHLRSRSENKRCARFALKLFVVIFFTSDFIFLIRMQLEFCEKNSIQKRFLSFS
jgi:hypothetical protein